jgi:nitroreductase
MDTRPVSNETVLKQLQWRYATKEFDPTRKISGADWHTLEQTLLLSPSSYGLQPWRFILVQDPVVREQLSAASWGQRQQVDSSHFIVFAAEKQITDEHIDRYIRRTAEVRGASLESLEGFRTMLKGAAQAAADRGQAESWNARQVYLPLGSLMTVAALLGIDSCPMEGFDPAKYDELLGLKERGLVSLAACALGFRKETDKYAELPKVRFPREEVFLAI